MILRAVELECVGGADLWLKLGTELAPVHLVGPMGDGKIVARFENLTEAQLAELLPKFQRLTAAPALPPVFRPF